MYHLTRSQILYIFDQLQKIAIVKGICPNIVKQHIDDNVSTPDSNVIDILSAVINDYDCYFTYNTANSEIDNNKCDTIKLKKTHINTINNRLDTSTQFKIVENHPVIHNLIFTKFYKSIKKNHLRCNKNKNNNFIK